MSTSSLSSLSTHYSSSSSWSRKPMSITNTYYLAHTARNKLAHEASRSDHRLSRLVGHANLLDSLMLKLGRAEQEHQRRPRHYASSSRATESADDSRHIEWSDCIVEEPEEDWQSSDADSSDSDSDYDSDEETRMEADMISLQLVSSHKVPPISPYADDNEGDFEVLQLQRTPSHANHPPELDHDSDSSEDDIRPPTPTTIIPPSFETQPSKPSLYSNSETSTSVIPPVEQQIFFDQGFYLPRRSNVGLNATISVC